jgi:hypothetical protein
MENEVFDILNGYKQALDILLERVEKLEQSVIDNKADAESKIKDLNDLLVEEVINPASEARDWAAKEERFDGWLERNGEKFAPYADDYKLIEGDEKDLARDMFDTYEGMEDNEGKPTEEEYVDSTIEKLVAQINKIKEAFGAKDVEVSTDENGEAEVKVDGEKVDEETVKEVVEGGEVAEETEEATEDELAEFEKELEAYKD